MELIRKYFPDLTSLQYEQLEALGPLYTDWNSKINVISRKDIDNLYEHHVLHSMAIAKTIKFVSGTRLADVGTGGGFPGVPLAVCYPDKEFVLMDSLQKRVKIVRELCDEIGLRNVTVIHGRAEELARKKEYRENFDLCVSRAVANMQVLSEYCLPFVKPGGYFIAYKGADCEAEISDASRAIRILGGDKPQIRELPQLDHSLVVVRKKESTPAAYPRKAGTPAKKPL